jgi:hypothetical protein
MTLVRKLALSISTRVVRWAAPGCKDWAEAQARELAFIPSDWRALAWALGSTRVLLDRRAGSRSEIPARPSFLDVILWLLYLEGSIYICARMFTATNWPRRVGWGLCLLACGYSAACSVFDWLRERWQPPTSDIQAYRLFLREGLELKLARYRTVRRWFPDLANLAAWVGYAVIVRGEVHFWGYFVACVWMGLHPMTDTPAKIQQRIERMNALIARPLQTGFKRLHSDHWGRPKTSSAGSASLGSR